MDPYPVRARSHLPRCGYADSLMDTIEQAQRLVAAQLDCTMDRALEVMTDTARATDESMEHIAEEIVAGRLTFG
jgi:ANTAR domain